MKICLLSFGKTDAAYIQEGVLNYEKRLKRYISFERIEIPDLRKAKNMSESQQKVEEGKKILDKIQNGDWIVLFDEKGVEFTSDGFAQFIQKKMNQSMKRIVFIIGGPYGFSEEVYQRANQKLALSKMTFSHQMVRLFAVEQIYRGFTILKGEPYHHK